MRSVRCLAGRQTMAQGQMPGHRARREGTPSTEASAIHPKAVLREAID